MESPELLTPELGSHWNPQAITKYFIGAFILTKIGCTSLFYYTKKYPMGLDTEWEPTY